MKNFLMTLAAVFALVIPSLALAASNAGGECNGGLCGTPNQSGGGCGCGCGCGSILVAMTDRGDTYQFADDFDGDGIEDEFDNCPFAGNYEQADNDGDMVGDACDKCPGTADPAQSDIDADGLGDLCDGDIDGDSIINAEDNCQLLPNADQSNFDLDSMGDACDADDDNDFIDDLTDPCRLGQAGVDACDDDPDLDGIDTALDNCPYISNPAGVDGLQADMNGDGLGDACDLDMDGDSIPNVRDNCKGIYNPSQLDQDNDGVGDAGNWTGGAESCDNQECYVIGGDKANCLDPAAAFNIYLNLIGTRVAGKFQVGDEITVALFSNRLGQLHNWSATFTKLPDSSDASLKNAEGSAATFAQSPQVVNCLEQDAAGACTKFNNIRFTPDAAGTYEIKVRADVPNLGEAATYTVIADVEGDAQGGCAAAGSSAGVLAAALGLLVFIRRRK